MTEDKFDEFLKKTAQSYNAPPARAPREEMWQAIQTTRNAGPRVVYGAGSSSGATPRRFGSRVWWAAAAALLLVASGVGIGRWTSPDAPSVNTVAGNLQSPAAPTSADEPVYDDRPGQLAEGENSAPVRAGTERSATPPGRNSRGTVADAGTAASARNATAPRSSTSPAYQIATANHLTQAEALLTSFRTRSTSDQRMDAQLASWARELLTNTRLLLDSPVAIDPERRPLLEDLELLLVQIVQLSPASTPQDREIIEQTLKQDQVLTKLRTAIPAGQRGS